jgi:peroxiredoxin
LLVSLAGIVAAPPATVLADEDGERRFRAYVFEGTCETVKSKPVADLGELETGHEAGPAMAVEAGADPDVAWGSEGQVDATLDELRASEHVVAVREERDGAHPIVACGDVSGDGDALYLELKAFGDTGVEGRARLERQTRVEETTQVAVGLWEVDAGAAGDRDMAEIPDFEVSLLDGETVHLSDYRGKTVVMVMWASWCPYCNAEFPMYEEMWQEMKDDDVVFLGIGLKNDDQGDAEAFIEKHGATFPVGRDTEGGSGARGEIESTLGVPGTPAVFIITPDGHVYGAQYGEIERGSFEDAIRDASQYRDGS